jgi:hypothetical protein
MASKEYYKITTSYCNYYACVWKQYPDQDRVFIGAKKKCVTFSIYHYDPDANLDGLGFSEDCNITGDLQRGQGTQHMLKTSMHVLMKMYPHLSGKFLFKDTSTIQGERNFKLSLAHHSILHHGKTWYERYFRAVPNDKPEIYYAGLKYLHNHVMTTKPELYIRHPQVILKYAKATSLKDFLHEMKDADAYFYKDWCSPLIGEVVPQVNDMTWCIDAHTLDLPSITVVKEANEPKQLFMMKGGGEDPSEEPTLVLNSPMDPIM